MVFDDDNDIKKLKITSKLKNSNSIFANVQKKPNKQEFEQSVKKIESKEKDYKQQASELSVLFKKILNDKTLVQNKSFFNSESEKEVLNKLIQLGIDINLDEIEKEGMGSIGLIALLFNCILNQKDKINNLDYMLNQLNSKICALEALMSNKI